MKALRFVLTPRGCVLLVLLAAAALLDCSGLLTGCYGLAERAAGYDARGAP